MPQRSSLGDGPGLRYRCVLSCDPDHAARLSSNYGQSEDRQGCYRRRDIKQGSRIKAIERLVQFCIEAHSRTLAQSGRPRWTHKHRRFANLSVVHRQLHLHHKILVFFISRSFIDLARHRDLTTSRVFVVNRHLHRRDIEILINIAPLAAY